MNRARVLTPLGLIVLALAVTWLSGAVVASAGVAMGVPQKLVGLYSRSVTSADVKKTGVPTGKWQLKIAGNGTATLHNIARDFDVTPAHVSVSSNRIVFRGMQCGPLGTYHWRISGRLLTFTKVRDSCVGRPAIIDGVWTKA